MLVWEYKTSDEEDYIVKEAVDLLSFDYMIKDGVFQVNMDEVLSQILKGSNIGEDYTFNVKVTGKSNFNINGIAKLEIPVVVLSEAETVHFELF
jgi:hypothetical protein